MYILLLGITIFIGIHLVPGWVGFRHKMVARLGERPYKGLYSITALAGLILIVYGKSKAGFQPIWEPPVWGKNAAILLMVFSFVLLVAAEIKSNIKRVTPHPMLWGVALWSGAHLIANGDLASMLLFGSFLAFSLFAMFSANMRGAAKQEKKYPLTKDVVAVLGAIVAYVVFIKYLHPYLIGVSII